MNYYHEQKHIYTCRLRVFNRITSLRCDFYFNVNLFVTFITKSNQWTVLSDFTFFISMVDVCLQMSVLLVFLIPKLWILIYLQFTKLISNIISGKSKLITQHFPTTQKRTQKKISIEWTKTKIISRKTLAVNINIIT